MQSLPSARTISRHDDGQSDGSHLNSPAEEYSGRLAAANALAARFHREDARIAIARGIVFLSCGLVLWPAFGTGWFSPWWTILPVLTFLALVVRHDRVIAGAARAKRVGAYYERGLDRLAGRWTGSGRTGERFAPADHLYAADLDCTGPGSLFELLCIARTASGERLFAAWLLRPAEIPELLARQESVAELRSRVDLRETMALAGEDLQDSVDTEWLTRWGEVTTAAPGSWLRLGVAAVVAVMLGAIILGTLQTDGPGIGLAVPILLAMATALALRGRARPILDTIDRPARELRTLARVLSVIEQSDFRSPRLQAIKQALRVDGRSPSRQVDRLRRLVTLLDWQRNQMFTPIALLLLWKTQVALALADWRAHGGPAIGRWVGAVAEIEALLSLAQHAYERPDDPFPDLVAPGPDPADAVFEGIGLAHPLLPADRAVRNDLTLDTSRRLLVVSGSNMSGKSTMLRTVGVNVVLAMAGGTVCARSLRLSPLALGASIRVHDSLLDGRSRFYAEILRLRDIVGAARERAPRLFLHDEILGGTNSHDRRIGAEAVVRSLLQNRGVGLVTTHDLALTALAEALAPGAANGHFEDQLVEGELRFDYRMHDGVVTHSNALALMRAVGIDV